MSTCPRCETGMLDVFEEELRAYAPNHSRCLICGYPLDLSSIMARIKIERDKISQTVRMKRDKDGLRWKTIPFKELMKEVEDAEKKEVLLPEYQGEDVVVMTDDDSNYFVFNFFNFGQYGRLGQIIRYISKKECLAPQIRDLIYGGSHFSLGEVRRGLITGCPSLFDILLPYICHHELSLVSRVPIASISDKIESHLQTCGFCARIVSVGASIKAN